ncbi:MAG: hypothetical protein QNJ97_12030 [Myxococcota bacterium]|nr:hypothetical protein [Myxococcota bacterium]
MPKTDLQQTIEQAATTFALEIVSAIKGATLQELIALQSEETPAVSVTERRPAKTPLRRPGPKPGPKPKAASRRATRTPRKKRTSYPKCAFTGCTKNRFPRGEGFCGEHWRAWKDGKIKSADSYTG